jgi:hypothetical protein
VLLLLLLLLREEYFVFARKMSPAEKKTVIKTEV